MNNRSILFSAMRPTPNPVTDDFGVNRDFGPTGWNPESAYSPIHTGVDYSARSLKKIVSPIDGEAWGELVPGMVGSMTMVRSNYSRDLVFYLLHCEPTAQQWKKVYRGQRLTTHAGHGIGLDHLHLELVVTEKLFQDLLSDGTLLPCKDSWRAFIEGRFKSAGFDVEKGMKRVDQNMKDRGLLEIGMNYIKASALPAYRMSKHLDVGKTGSVYFVDPRVFGTIGHDQ
jgi:hypothetical protein